MDHENTTDPATNEWDYKISVDDGQQETARSLQETERTRIVQRANAESYRHATNRTAISGIITLAVVGMGLLILANAYLHNACIEKGLQWKGTYCEMRLPPMRVHVEVQQGSARAVPCEIRGSVVFCGPGIH